MRRHGRARGELPADDVAVALIAPASFDIGRRGSRIRSKIADDLGDAADAREV
jgi:hypothetical protein